MNRLIGRGSFSRVYAGRTRDGSTQLAFKVVDKTLFKCAFNLRTIIQEIKVMRDLSHPHIISSRDVLQTKRNVYIVS